jgi:multimeric flavodoxin WrbA
MDAARMFMEALKVDLLKHLAPKPRESDIEKISQDEFKSRFIQRFKDPVFDKFRDAINQMADAAWSANQDAHKAPLTSKAGEGFADPNYNLSDDWRAAKKSVDAAKAYHENPRSKDRILVISGANRNDKTCPGEVSKSRVLAQLAIKTLEAETNCTTELLDLSLITSEYGKMIYPCKGCVSTAMPLCHFPCSCYPNYSLGQVDDWMNDIYPKWIAAHGVMIVTPVYWYQAPSALKLMIDRLVCCDGGNPDPTSTHGKDAQKAKQIELDGWDYPRHLANRMFSVVVHGDAAGVDHLRTSLSSWMQDMRMISAGIDSNIGRYIGYYGPYAKSHEALDKDDDIKIEVQNAAKVLAHAVKAQRLGQLDFENPNLKDPRAK